MKVELLQAELDELGTDGIDGATAFARGLRALGARSSADEQREALTRGNLDGLVHAYAEAAADERLIRFAFTTKSGEYQESSRRYESIDDDLRVLQLSIVPERMQQLRRLREREAELEQMLLERGINPAEIGPHVPSETAIDPELLRPETDRQLLTLSPLPPNRSLLQRVLAKLRG